MTPPMGPSPRAASQCASNRIKPPTQQCPNFPSGVCVVCVSVGPLFAAAGASDCYILRTVGGSSESGEECVNITPRNVFCNCTEHATYHTYAYRLQYALALRTVVCTIRNRVQGWDLIVVDFFVGITCSLPIWPF